MHAEIVDERRGMAGRAKWVERVALIISNGQRMGRSPQQIAEMIADSATRRTVILTNIERLVLEAGGIPDCWICGLRIYLDEPEDSDAEITVDHVDGRINGFRNGDNVRAAHRLCNVVREAKHLKKRTERRCEELRFYLRWRMDCGYEEIEKS